MWSRHMDEDELCALFSVELDIESKYYQMMPYDSNDSDFDWHKLHTSSEDSEPDCTSTKPPAKNDARGERDESYSKSGDKRRKVKRETKRKKKGKTPPHRSGRTVTVMSSKFKETEFEFTHGAETSKHGSPLDTPSVIDMPALELMSTNRTIYQNNKSPTPDSDSDEDARRALQKHRRLISCNNTTSAPKRDSTGSSTMYPLNVYPSNWQSVEPTALNSTFPPYIPTPNSPSDVYSSNYDNESQVPTKRTRWSSYSSTDTNSVDLKTSSSGDMMPNYKHHQLLGDSQLLRFSEQLLNFRRYVTYAEKSYRRLGYCVSGQKIGDLHQRLLKNEFKLSPKIVMLIGTNDMVYDTRLNEMCEKFDSILNILKENGVQKIVTLTVPPIPRMDKNSEYWNKLRRFNNFIISRAEEGRIFAIDLASVYISYDNKPSLKYFEEKFGRTSKVDLVHLNHDGFKLLKAVLDINYFDKFRFDIR